MSQLEITIVVLLLLMSVPDLCARLGRRSLTFIVYILFGVCCAPILSENTRAVMSGIGHFGFILLLFVVGLEIDLPKLARLRQRFSVLWKPLALLYGCILLCVAAVGFSKESALFAAAALSACAISLAHPAMAQLTGLRGESLDVVKTHMVLLEVQAMIVLVAGEVFLHHGFGWRLPLHLIVVFVAVAALAYVADHVTRGLRLILEKASHWKTHMLVLLILVICALGDRLGLPAPKSAFFLGLFMSRTSGQGMLLEEHLAPISHRFLIPVFFVALGARVDLTQINLLTMVSAVCAGIFLLEIKWRLLGRVIPDAAMRHDAALLLVPNLTIVAIAAEALYHIPTMAWSADWLVLCGLTMTLIAIVRLPPSPASSTDGTHAL